MRRLPPSNVEQNLRGLIDLLPDETDELLQRVDQPLQEAVDAATVVIDVFINSNFPIFIVVCFREGSIYCVIIIEMRTHIGKFCGG